MMRKDVKGVNSNDSSVKWKFKKSKKMMRKDVSGGQRPKFKKF
jgi:hypothetical protein